MKFMLIISALMAAILAMAVPPPNAPTVVWSMSPNATDVLTAHGIWAPDPNAFAQGKPNVDGIDLAAESDKLAQSGIEIEDLVHFTIHNTTAASEKVDCSRCHLCLEACVPMLLFYPICFAGCVSQWYCDQCI